MNSFSVRAPWLLMVVCFAAVGCKLKLNRSREGAEAAPAASASAASASPATSVEPPTVPARPPVKRAVGPSYAVEPGLGLGPIRFGSTVATVERHMDAKCEELTDKYCRYITSGIELELTNGAVSGISIHRYQRPVAGDASKTWGMFRGGIPPKIFMMMVPEAVIEQLGKPKRTEAVKEDNPNWTVRRDYYDGMVLEYDKNRVNDRLMLGEIRIVKR